MRHLWAVLLISAATLPVLWGMSGAGVAQTSDPQPRSADDGPPPGGCTPIGLTVSGEIVFPMSCKDFIERHKAADRAATAAAEKPAAAEASKAPEAVEAAKAPATAETSNVRTANEPGKALTTGEAVRASATTEVSSAPAAVDASKAPTVPVSSKSEEKDARPAPETTPADEATRPETRQAAVAPQSTDTGKSSTGKSSAEPGTTSALSKRSRARNHVASSAPCTRFRTYDAASGTYRDFGGRRRSCP